MFSPHGTLATDLQVIDGDESDYGSDLDEDSQAALTALLDDFATAPDTVNPRPFVLESIDEHALPASFVQVPSSSAHAANSWQELHASLALQAEPESPTANQFSLPQQDGIDRAPQEEAVTAATDQSNDAESQTPLQRFRTAPRKPLSVTDLVSPSWCELQYWYVLTKHGRKKRTPAMKQGTAIHQALEDQVHTAVPVTVQTREDHWGLRIWNVIHGLRTLRTQGMTRELEVWGVIDGQVVNGIIDHLSFDCTDEAMEARITQSETSKDPEASLPSDQPTIAAFFGSKEPSSIAARLKQRKTHSATVHKVYLTDVKTRQSATLPAGASLRPTTMQLMLYRRIINDLVLDQVPSSSIFERYRLDPALPLSDELIAQLCNLDMDSTSSPGESNSQQSPDTMTELLAHNTLAQLWQLMIHEYQQSMPHGSASISKVLCAEFRHSSDGTIIGHRTFPCDDAAVNDYIGKTMQWWNGERSARGVDIEEAFKCRICEFADECSWRAAKIEDAVKKSRSRARRNDQSDTT